MKPETVAEQLLFTTAYIESTFPREETSSTGFLYLVNTSSGNQLFLVTNRHVVFDESRGGLATKIKVKLIKAGADGSANLGEFTFIHSEDFGQKNWYGHPNPEIDIAIIPFGSWVEELVKLGQRPFFRTISPEMVYETGTKPELDSLEEITFIGYPNGLFDLKHHLPIVRRGITATSIDIDFNGMPHFIIDAGVYPGSSGSPVFILNQGWIKDRQGNLSMGSRVVLVGVISRTYHRTSIAEVRDSSTALSASVQEIIGLGTVVKARCIDETVRDYLKSIGHSQI